MIAKLRTSVDAAYEAILEEDYVLALKHTRAARAALIAIPRSKLKEEEIEMNVSDLDNQIRDLERCANEQKMAEADSSGPFGISIAPIRFTR